MPNTKRDVAVSGIFDMCFVDFGVSSVISDYGDRSRPKVRKTFVGTPCWMAPEVMEQVRVIKYYMYMYSYLLATVEHCNIEADICEVAFCWNRCSCMQQLLSCQHNMGQLGRGKPLAVFS